MSPITDGQIRAEVQEFWRSFTAKEKADFERRYLPTAVCFSADGRRAEPARLMWVRREREFFGPKSAVSAKLGAIHVQLLRADLAVASYPFHFAVIRILPNGKRVKVDVPFARTTQVFHQDPEGGLVIIHEHLSSGEPVNPTEMPSE
ncbi:MAG TPA: hypothetical protein VN176_03445 [Verrucomicrobiae bacterium]|jgi:hypothetical protein|nr:hypothetical protein [Verrucomicrobiae bacterium]